MLNYIGSKWSLLPMIEGRMLRKGLHGEGVFCDLFAGTTAVGQMAKRMGYTVISNDWQTYSYALAQAYIVNCAYPQFDALGHARPDIFARLDEGADYQASLPRPIGNSAEARAREPLAAVLDHLDALPPVDDGFIYQQYCAGGAEDRRYYSDANGQRCDAIRRQIEQWKQADLLTDSEYYILIVALMEAIDRVANTASVYAAYLKRLKASAARSLHLTSPRLVLGPTDARARPHEAHRADANALIERINCDVLYIDPPYNQRQYATNYHMLETIVAYDAPKLSGKTGLRPYADQKSRYCSRKEVRDAFDDLINRARRHARHIIISYNDEGLLHHSDITRALGRLGSAEMHPVAYRRFRADRDSAGDTQKPKRVYAGNTNVTEYLFYVRNDALARAAS